MNIDQFKQWCVSYNSPNLLRSSKPLIMGVLNVTPDSFSDGGKYFALENAIERAHEMIAEGADLIDIGGESTRPGALSITSEEELKRVMPVIKKLRSQSDVCISIDTRNPEVMCEAVDAGASLINNIEGFKNEASLKVAAKLNVPLCIMHMQGNPQNMQINPSYSGDIIDEINLYFQNRIEACLAAGINRNQLILDPGFGFGKTLGHNIRLVKQIAKFKQHNLPLMLGVSRKSTIGSLLNTPIHDRLIGGIVIAVYSQWQGLAMVRTHDVAETQQALQIAQAISEAS